MAINWAFHLQSLNLVFLFHLISLGSPISVLLQNMYLRNLAFVSRARGYFSPSQLLTIKNHRFVLLWNTDLMSGVVLLNLLSIFLTESSLKLSVSSTIQSSLILYSLSPIVVLLQIFPFSTAIFTDIALRKARILFLIQ